MYRVFVECWSGGRRPGSGPASSSWAYKAVGGAPLLTIHLGYWQYRCKKRTLEHVWIFRWLREYMDMYMYMYVDVYIAIYICIYFFCFVSLYIEICLGMHKGTGHHVWRSWAGGISWHEGPSVLAEWQDLWIWLRQENTCIYLCINMRIIYLLIPLPVYWTR